MKRNPHPGLETLAETQVELLHRFEGLLQGRGAALGVVASGDRDRIWERHIVDSLRGVACMPPGASSMADIGSGGGLPGVPIAIARPDLAMHLVEPRARRAAFLEWSVQVLGLANVHVVPERAEGLSIAVSGCMARALAPPVRTWRLADPLLPPDGFVLYWAGRTWGLSDERALAAIGVTAAIGAPASQEGQGSVVIMRRTVTTPRRGTR